uniref:CEP76 N-terminal domain-containing protein n=1 Tax=Equus caballus TaxID=9796 RepID=A0A9L0TT58_HORSE
MSLPPEKASELKQLIHQQLSKMDVHGRIREILAETIREELAPDQQQLSTEDLIKALRRRGIIDDVMKRLNFVTAAQCFVGSNPGCGRGTAHQTTLRQRPTCHN